MGLDLLKGVLIGLGVGIAFVLRESMQHAFTVKKTERQWHIILEKDTFFFTRAALATLLSEVPRNVHLVIDANAARFVDHDIIETLNEFRLEAIHRGVEVEVKGLALQAMQ